MPRVIPQTLLLLTALMGCGDNPGSGPDPASCATGTAWTGGNSGSPEMHPGHDCIACHATGEGPNFKIAGTVYADYSEPDDCDGEAGVTVEITDAAGDITELQTNGAGNFYVNAAADIAMPYTARVLVDGVQVGAMATPQSDGSCAACHTADGAQGAPGRIIAPPG